MKIIRFFIVYILIQAILLTPARASSLGGWSMGNPVASGASTIYDGARKAVIDGKNYIKKGTAIVKPTATQVAKVLARGGAAYALSVAVEELIGAVDWVLDPANNRIIYFELTDEISGGASFGCNGSTSNSQTLESSLNNCTPDNWTQVKLTPKGVQTLANTLVSMTVGQTKDLLLEVSVVNSNNSNTAPVVTNTYLSVTKLGQPAEREEKYLPLSTVASRVISNAESEDDSKAKPAQVATTAAAADVVAEAETDQTGVKARPIVQQLEKSAETKAEDEAAAEKANEATGEQTKNPTKPDTTDLKLEFPAFCGWAPVVCEAAQVVISFPTLVTEWWNTANEKADSWTQSISEAWEKTKEWTKEGEKEQTELDIPEPPEQEIDTDISFSGQCPDDKKIPFNIGGFSYDLNFSYSLICQPLSQAKPILILVGAFLSALIIGGIRQ